MNASREAPGASASVIHLRLIADEPQVMEYLSKAFNAYSSIRLWRESNEKGNSQTVSPGVMFLAVKSEQGVERLVAQLRREGSTVRLVCFLVDFNVSAALAAIRLGVEGIVDLLSSAPELLEAVQHAARGEFFLPANLARRLLLAAPPVPQQMQQPARERLSLRELEVLRLIAEGASNRDIGEKLAISENTVRAHVRSLLQKLKVRNRAHAAALAKSLDRRGFHLPPGDDVGDESSAPRAPE